MTIPGALRRSFPKKPLDVQRRERPSRRRIMSILYECDRTPILPGFELSVGRLLAVADRWRSSKEQS